MRLPNRSAWTLDPGIAYLNHGSFGATPTCVLAEQQALREKMERNPVDFLLRRLPELLESVRATVATFLRADAEGLVFVDNATTGTQTVIAQARLQPGDEVLATDHCYPAVLAQLRRATESTRALLRTAQVPLSVSDRAQVAEAVLSRLTRRTKLAVVDHVASGSGLVFPVEEIAAECRRQGVPVLIDSAHGPGQLPVDLDRIGADYWVGNMHKWVCAPKASAVLQVAPQWRDTLRPLVASHGFGDGYQASFDWTGTRDPTALLAVPTALDFFGRAGWLEVWQRNDGLAAQGAQLIADRLGTEVPLGPGLSAAMRLVPLAQPLDEAGARHLEHMLAEVHRVMVPVTDHGGWRWLRVSAQLYNTVRDYERLADALAPGGDR